MIEIGTTEEMGSTVRAVDRAVAILRAFSVRAPILSVAQIQASVNLSRPTVYRLLETLEATGLVKSEGNPQCFRLAHGVMQLARVWLAGINLPDISQRIVESLRDDTGETSALFIPRGDLRLCVLEYRSHEVLAIARGIGDTGPLIQGASGKAILAFMSDTNQEEIVAKLPEKSKRTRLFEELIQIRRKGYALSRGEVFAGAVAVAAPVFDHSGEIVGSLGVFGPESRMNEQRTTKAARQVVAATREISALLGTRAADTPPTTSK